MLETIGAIKKGINEGVISINLDRHVLKGNIDLKAYILGELNANAKQMSRYKGKKYKNPFHYTISNITCLHCGGIIEPVYNDLKKSIIFKKEKSNIFSNWF